MEQTGREFMEYYINNLDIEIEKEFAKLHSPNCCGIYSKNFNDIDFFCIDIIYKGNGEYWFALCTSTTEDNMNPVEYLYESDDIRELTEELVKKYEKEEAEKIINTGRKL